MTRLNPKLPNQAMAPTMADAVNDLPVAPKKPEPFSLAIRPEEQPIIDEMQSIVVQLQPDALAKAGEFGSALILARGMNRLRELIRQSPAFKAALMELQGSAMGFRTDRDRPPNGHQGAWNPGYAWEVVSECALEALIRGARPTNNEFNIIAQNCYLAKNFFSRMVETFPGLTDLKKSPGVPVVKPNSMGAIVPYRVEWRMKGEAFHVERDIPVRVNGGMGADAILGKATCKILAAVYGRLTGSEWTVPDGEIDDGPPPPPPTGSAQDVAARVQAARDAAAANAAQGNGTPQTPPTASKPPSQPLPTINPPPEDGTGSK